MSDFLPSCLQKSVRFKRLPLPVLRCALVWLTWMMAPVEVMGHGAYVERVGRLLVALEQRPDDLTLHLELADARCEHGEWQLALEELKSADRVAPGNRATDLLRGRAFLVGEKPLEATLALDRFLAAHPRHVLGLTLRARAAQTVKDSAASLADYRAAWELTPRPEPDFVQEFSQALASAGQAEESLAVLNAGIEKLGAIPSLVLLALERETAAGRFEAALTRIDALEKNSPRREPWMAKRAHLLARMGRTDEARAAWSGLIAQLSALPNLERGSHAMSLLAEEARRELRALEAQTKPSLPPPSSASFSAPLSSSPVPLP